MCVYLLYIPDRSLFDVLCYCPISPSNHMYMLRFTNVSLGLISLSFLSLTLSSMQWLRWSQSGGNISILYPGRQLGLLGWKQKSLVVLIGRLDLCSLYCFGVQRCFCGGICLRSFAPSSFLYLSSLGLLEGLFNSTFGFVSNYSGVLDLCVSGQSREESYTYQYLDMGVQ